MKRVLLTSVLACFAVLSQAQSNVIQYGFAVAKYGYDFFSSDDPDSYYEIVVNVPGNDTLHHKVGSFISVIDGTAKRGINFNMPAFDSAFFYPGTTVHNLSNRRKFMINPAPDLGFWGRKYFQLNLYNYEGIIPSESVWYGKDTITIYLDYDGSNIGLPKVSVDEYSLYPNPSRDRIYIDGLNLLDYRVFDMTGRTVLSADRVAGNMVDLSGLNTGVYFIRSETSKGVLVHKIIKE
jgi:hypothetical protein